MSAEWKHQPHPEAEAKAYKVWKREAALGTVYCVQRGEFPPHPDCGGFYRLSTALWVVRLKESM